MTDGTARAHHVGSLLRPQSLRDAFRQHHAGELSDAEYRARQDAEIERVVARQEQLGLRVVTDGELRRASYWAAFVDAVDGLEVRDATFDFTDERGDRIAFTAPHVGAEIRRTRPVAVDELRFVAAHTAARPKITLPAPSTMHFWRGPDAISAGVYTSSDEMFAALGQAYREEITALATAGAAFVQLDEVALAMLCDPDIRDAVTARGEKTDELVEQYVATVNDAFRNAPPGLTTAMHVCRGNYKGHWLASGGYQPIAEAVFGGAQVDWLLLEFDSERAGTFGPLAHVRPDTGVALGLVSSKTGNLERRDDLLRRIDEAARYVPVERLALSPQCGFASTVAGNPLTEDDQWRKLELIVAVANEVWGSA